jgi:phage-related minor tail protein
MSDTEGYKFQTSIKHGPGLVVMTNIRANDPDELEASLSALISAAPTINDAVEALGVVEQFAKAGVKAEVVGQSPADAADATSQSCKHGLMQFRSAADWAGHFCPLDKSNPDRCKPIYKKKG